MLHRALCLILLTAATLTGCSTARPYAEFYLQDNSAAPSGGKVKATFLGTTSILFDDGVTQVLIDGYFTRMPVPNLDTFVQSNPAAVDAVLARAGIGNRLKAIFVAHSHFDHALDCALVARRTGATVYGSPSTLIIAEAGGVPLAQRGLFAPNTDVPVGSFTVRVLNSAHSPPIGNMDISGTISTPFPASPKARDFKEGGSFDFKITRNNRSILVKPSANFVAGALNSHPAEVLFLGTGTLGLRPDFFKTSYYQETVSAVHPRLVIPIHWDDFREPLSDQLKFLSPLDTAPAFNFLIPKLQNDQIVFGIMDGYRSVMLFDP